MKADRQMKRGGLAALATALFLNSGACVEPYAYIRINEQVIEPGIVGEQPVRVIPAPPSDSYIIRKECPPAYALTAADSMRKPEDKRTVQVCTCYDSRLPRHHQKYTCEVNIDGTVISLE